MMIEGVAPLAGSVVLRTVGGDSELESVGDGLWRCTDALDADADYSFVLDGGDPLPDPRSRRQPEGVHQASRAYDPHSYDWSDDDWSGRQLAGGVIYELHIGTFTPEGTLDSAIEKLDHLVKLGVDFVELLPVNGFNGTHNWAMTACSGTRSTRVTAAQPPTSASWMPATPVDSRSSRTSSTTTWGRAATTSSGSAHT